jgi:hypothetical protein
MMKIIRTLQVGIGLLTFSAFTGRGGLVDIYEHSAEDPEGHYVGTEEWSGVFGFADVTPLGDVYDGFLWNDQSPFDDWGNPTDYIWDQCSMHSYADGC